MKDKVTKCCDWKAAIRLQAGGALAAAQTVALDSHLATCADCREYADDLRVATSGLRWLASRPVEAGPNFRQQWTAAVVRAAAPSGFADLAGSILDWCRSRLRRNRRPVFALASVWAAIFLFKFTAPEVSPAASATVAHSPVEIFRALKSQEQLLAGQAGHREPPPRTRQKTSSDRSEDSSGTPSARASKGAVI